MSASKVQQISQMNSRPAACPRAGAQEPGQDKGRDKRLTGNNKVRGKQDPHGSIRATDSVVVYGLRIRYGCGQTHTTSKHGNNSGFAFMLISARVALFSYHLAEQRTSRLSAEMQIYHTRLIQMRQVACVASVQQACFDFTTTDYNNLSLTKRLVEQQQAGRKAKQGTNAGKKAEAEAATAQRLYSLLPRVVILMMC